ncbi:23S rRNA (pseudouridine(1915)-N(3))-methyltransferase RlmH [Tindallia californiensis]|uniref:Ribosomal RNA large subunit methyltransferase H n=1 Tax=Tindallia californiensis TaxID=159292 RepID=A0A1H3QI49_9FIRM|nr:23S rRNA (pseudouridine(1915)-N(3))-methyltransferase RlmH [Tindallia californiensis]SDZ13027.1 23S rRNA (pseudouridine1915-N3)-methyltransferase [Tindallia californiensis]
MNITLISVGKIKEKYLTQAIQEYSKRLSRYCKLTHMEVADEKAPENLSAAEEEQIKAKEGQRILQKISEQHYLIVLDLGGDMLSSEGFAQKIDKLALTGKSQLAFVIGGSLGLSSEVLTRADEKLSFSKMTFPHQLMKVILLEQIYRGFRINRNEPYHK